MPLLYGGVTVLVVFAALWWGLLGLFTGGGLIIVFVTAHSAATAVAVIVGSRSTREPGRELRAVAAAILAAVLMFAATISLYLLLAYSFREVFPPRGGMIACLAIGYIVAEFAAGRFEPTWSRYARPLALVTFAVTLTVIWSLLRASL